MRKVLTTTLNRHIESYNNFQLSVKHLRTCLETLWNINSQSPRARPSEGRVQDTARLRQRPDWISEKSGNETANTLEGHNGDNLDMRYAIPETTVKLMFDFWNTTKIYQHTCRSLLAHVQSPAGVSKRLVFPKKNTTFFGAWAKCKQLRFTGWYLPNWHLKMHTCHGPMDRKFTTWALGIFKSSFNQLFGLRLKNDSS